MTAENIGSKRPNAFASEDAGPRKRPPGDIDDQLIDEAFEMETQVEQEQEDVIMTEDDALEVDEGILGEAGKNWMRPKPPQIDPSTETVLFQQFEVDYNTGAPNRAYYATDLYEVPIIRMFGVNEHGNSVCAFVHGFEPYFYVEAPTHSFSPDDCASLTETLNFALSGRDRSKNPRSCLRIEVIQRQTILFYQPQTTRAFLKVVMAGPQLVSTCRGLYSKN